MKPGFKSDIIVVVTDNKKWPYRLFQDLVYVTLEAKDGPWKITIKDGFLTDFASIPRVPFIYDQFAEIPGTRGAAIVHDATCRYGTFSRRECDAIFYEAMLLSGASKWKAWIMWASVRAYSLFATKPIDGDLAQKEKYSCHKI
jgi:hypothetical protein